MSIRTITDKATYLTFHLGNEIFAVNVLKIREVLELTRITNVPKMPDFVMGVINVRGSIVPVVDLKQKFGMQSTENTINTCIVVIEVPIENNIITIGCLADSVEEVINLDPDQIDAAPHIGTSVDTEFIKGIGKKADSFIIVLDIESVFSGHEINMVDNSIETIQKSATADR